MEHRKKCRGSGNNHHAMHALVSGSWQAVQRTKPWMYLASSCCSAGAVCCPFTMDFSVSSLYDVCAPSSAVDKQGKRSVSGSIARGLASNQPIHPSIRHQTARPERQRTRAEELGDLPRAAVQRVPHVLHVDHHRLDAVPAALDLGLEARHPVAVVGVLDGLQARDVHHGSCLLLCCTDVSAALLSLLLLRCYCCCCSCCCCCCCAVYSRPPMSSTVRSRAP